MPSLPAKIRLYWFCKERVLLAGRGAERAAPAPGPQGVEPRPYEEEQLQPARIGRHITWGTRGRAPSQIGYQPPSLRSETGRKSWRTRAEQVYLRFQAGCPAGPGRCSQSALHFLVIRHAPEQSSAVGRCSQKRALVHFVACAPCRKPLTGAMEPAKFPSKLERFPMQPCPLLGRNHRRR